MKDKFFRFLIEKVLRVQWIINDMDEFGVRVLGINMYYYKWPTPILYDTNKPSWRPIYKREFGEIIRGNYKFTEELREKTGSSTSYSVSSGGIR